MGIASSPTSCLPVRHQPSRVLRIVLPLPILLVWIGALVFVPHAALGQRFREAPMFAGKMIADPPSQGQPWTAPATKLPRFLVTATEILFEQGVADPRGCEYHEVEIGDDMIMKVHGFVLPERAELAGRFVVCWDGLVYPALTVAPGRSRPRHERPGRRVQEKPREPKEGSGELELSWDTADEGPRDRSTAGVDSRSPIKLCLLLRLGRADPGGNSLRRGNGLDPGGRWSRLLQVRRQLPDPGDRLGGLCLPAAHRCSCAGRRRDRARHRRRLARFRDLASAKADEMGFPRSNRQNRGGAGLAPGFTSSPSSTSCSVIRSGVPRCPRARRLPREGATPRPGSRP